MAFHVTGDETPQQNGDLAIRSDKGRLVGIVYATDNTQRYAEIIVTALNRTFDPACASRAELEMLAIELFRDASPPNAMWENCPNRSHYRETALQFLAEHT